MHDASETYTVDIPRPLKYLLNMDAYREHEKRVQRAICSWFDMVPVEPASVKEADTILLVTEQRDLLNNSIKDYDIDPLPGKIKPWTSPKAERLFLERFKELTKKS
jgi:5'-deoxynucleotidase YfbR-like HD superfamily hydrolase